MGKQRKKFITIEEQVIVYNIIISILYHYEDVGLVKLEPQIEFVGSKKVNKSDKRLLKEIDKLMKQFGKEVNTNIENLIKEKTEKTFKFLEPTMKYKEWCYLIFGVTLFENYVKEPNRHFIKSTHVGSIRKLFNLVLKDYKLNLLDSLNLNSIELGNKFYKKVMN